jgi:hypothetical protein
MDTYGVEFHDLEFDYGFRMVKTRDGKCSRRWVPIGMPRIPHHFERCTFFLYGYHPKTGVLSGPGATGFFVAMRSESLRRLHHIYAVSNRHTVIDFSCIRINRKGSGTRLIELDPSEWISSDTDDLAAVDVTDLLVFNHQRFSFLDNITWIRHDNFITDEINFLFNIGIGDETVMMGLFADHDGGTQNVPVGRFGLLSAMPNKSAPVRLWRDDPFVRPAYLNDTRSRAGFSGSPVWVWRSPYGDMNQVEIYGRDVPFRRTEGFLFLAGVHRGQFREQTVIGSLKEEARPLQSGDEIEIAR